VLRGLCIARCRPRTCGRLRRDRRVRLLHGARDWPLRCGSNLLHRWLHGYDHRHQQLRPLRLGMRRRIRSLRAWRRWTRNVSLRHSKPLCRCADVSLGCLRLSGLRWSEKEALRLRLRRLSLRGVRCPDLPGWLPLAILEGRVYVSRVGSRSSAFRPPAQHFGQHFGKSPSDTLRWATEQGIEHGEQDV
jgi:hypothetical protein